MSKSDNVGGFEEQSSRRRTVNIERREKMGLAIGMIGFLGFFVCVIWLLIRLIKRDSKKGPAIGLLVCFLLFMAGAMMMPKSDDDSTPVASKSDEEPSKSAASTSKDSADSPASSSQTVNTPSTSSQTNQVNVDDPVDVSTSSESTINLELIMAVLKITLTDNYGEDNFTLEYDDTAATINLWSDGIALGSALAANGNKEAIEAWGSVIEGHKYLCNSVVEQIESNGIENYVVMINILNDLDTSKTILTILNGEVIYDVVNS